MDTLGERAVAEKVLLRSEARLKTEFLWFLSFLQKKWRPLEIQKTAWMDR